jgi:hypothetical protein
MIPEAIEYLATPCSRPLRGMGYLRELMAIRGRAWRCWTAWKPHLEKSKSIIRAAVALCHERRKAVILGSGMLYDVPVDELSGTFREVLLVDIVHPLKNWLPRLHHKNMRRVTADVTGTAEEVFRVAKVSDATLPRTEPNLFLDDPEVDLVVSLNLLSQLPVIPTTYLERVGAHSPEAIAAFARHLVASHLAYLRRFACTVALITDVEKLTLNRAGTVVGKSSLLRGVELPGDGESWIWQLAPFPEADPDYSYHRRVVGIANIKAISKRTLAGHLPSALDEPDVRPGIEGTG